MASPYYHKEEDLRRIEVPYIHASGYFLFRRNTSYRCQMILHIERGDFMRKIGFSALLSGFLLSLFLYLLRQSDWFAAEVSRGMSDFAELVESAFWAALLLSAFGLLCLLLSFRPAQRLPENEAPAPLVRNWICPACGEVSDETEMRCPVCGTPRNRGRVPSWRCSFCGAENPETAVQCQICASPKDRPLLTWFCEGCGHENSESELRCTACQRRRFSTAASWICPVCGSANDAGADVCRLCDVKRKTDAWTCSYCGRQNRDSRSVCSNCGKPRNAKGRTWLCPVCGTQNRIDRPVCACCGQARG